MVDRFMVEPPRSVQQAYQALLIVSDQLQGARQADAAFTDAYAIITRRVMEEVTRSDCHFQEPGFISRLAAQFCCLYLTSMHRRSRNAHEVIPAWNIAHDAVQTSGLTPLHHVVLGLNAHINYDLAVGLHLVVRDSLWTPELLARCKHDHDHVNEIIETAAVEILEVLARKYQCPLSLRLLDHDERTVKAFTQLAMVPLGSWRERVWTDFLRLLNEPAERTATYTEMSGRAYRYGWAIVRSRSLLFPAEAAR